MKSDWTFMSVEIRDRGAICRGSQRNCLTGRRSRASVQLSRALCRKIRRRGVALGTREKTTLALVCRLIGAYDSISGVAMTSGLFHFCSGTVPKAFSSNIRAAAPKVRTGDYTALALILGCLAFAVPGCSVTSWKSALGRNHPLTGRIWDVTSARFINRQSLVARLAGADFLLLGERHDNPDHHILQAEVLRSMIAAGRRPAVGFEMLGLDDAPAIAGYLAAAPNDAAGLGRAVNWNERGWPDWAMYQVIAEVALAAKLRIVPTDLPLGTARMMRSTGLAALEPRLTRALGLDGPLSEAMSAR